MRNTRTVQTPTVDEVPGGGRNGQIVSGFTLMNTFKVSFHNFRPRSGSVGPPTGLSSFVGAPGMFIKDDDFIRPGNTNNGAMIFDRVRGPLDRRPGSPLCCEPRQRMKSLSVVAMRNDSEHQHHLSVHWIVGAPAIFIKEDSFIRPGNTNNGAYFSFRIEIDPNYFAAPTYLCGPL